MGLLDDAIREHLELKRRRGADPTEVARQQREALAPVGGGGDAAWGAEGSEAERPEDGQAAAEHPVEAPPAAVEPSPAALEEHPTEAHEAVPAAAEEPTPAVEETAEIDMQSVLDSEPASIVSHEPAPARELDADEPLDWEMARRPGEGIELDEREDVPREIPGQERMPFE
jgi:hypothetical protein